MVCATAAPEAVVSLSAAESAIRKRPARPLFFIDLALPRDVEPSVALLDNVFVYNLDDLAQISTANRAARVGEVTRARALLSTKSDLLWRTLVRSASAGRPPSDQRQSDR